MQRSETGRFVAALQRFDRNLYRVCVASGATILLLVVVVVFAQVLSRYLLKRPIVWSEELSSYLFIWLSMLGAAATVHAKGHFCFGMVLDKLARGPRRIVELGLLAGCIVVSLTIGWLGAVMAANAGNTSASLGISMGWFYAAIPCSAIVMALHFAVKCIEAARRRP